VLVEQELVEQVLVAADAPAGHLHRRQKRMKESLGVVQRGAIAVSGEIAGGKLGPLGKVPDEIKSVRLPMTVVARDDDPAMLSVRGEKPSERRHRSVGSDGELLQMLCRRQTAAEPVNRTEKAALLRRRTRDDKIGRGQSGSSTVETGRDEPSVLGVVDNRA
jgi:hypothetical protein